MPAELSDSMQAAIANDLMSTAGDTAAEPVRRAIAITWLRCYASRPETQDFLVALLQPAAWFFDIPGEHGLEHSTVAVLEALSESNDPTLPARLAFFSSLIPQIPETQGRAGVERLFRSLSIGPRQ